MMQPDEMRETSEGHDAMRALLLARCLPGTRDFVDSVRHGQAPEDLFPAHRPPVRPERLGEGAHLVERVLTRQVVDRYLPKRADALRHGGDEAVVVSLSEVRRRRAARRVRLGGQVR